MIKNLISLANHLDKKGLTKEADYLDSIIQKVAEEEEDSFYSDFEFSNNYGPRRTLTESAKKAILINIEMFLVILEINQGISDHQDEKINKYKYVGALLKFIESERFLPEALNMVGRGGDQSIISNLGRSDRMGVANKVNEIKGHLFSIYNKSQGAESFDLRVNSEDIDDKVNTMIEFLKKAKEFYSGQGKMHGSTR